MYNPSRKVADWYWRDLKDFMRACGKLARAINLREAIKEEVNFEAHAVFERYYNGSIGNLEKTIRETKELQRAALKEFNRQCAWAHVYPVPNDQCEAFIESMTDRKRRDYYNGIIAKFKEAKIPTVLSVKEIEAKYQEVCAKRREREIRRG